MPGIKINKPDHTAKIHCSKKNANLDKKKTNKYFGNIMTVNSYHDYINLFFTENP